MYTSYVLCHILSAVIESQLNEVLFEGTYYLFVYSYVKVPTCCGAQNISTVLKQDGDTLFSVSSGP